VHDPTTGFSGYPSDYKKNGFVVQYDVKGEVNRQWNVYGIWPSSFDPGDADQAGEEIVRINMTLTMDKALLTDDLTGPDAYPDW
jgi:hypothetical protein